MLSDLFHIFSKEIKLHESHEHAARLRGTKQNFIRVKLDSP